MYKIFCTSFFIDEKSKIIHTGFMEKEKYIALVDCDCFFVSCERKVNPDLKGKPVSVVSGDNGCVLSRSIEAKQMGVRMGEPMFMAKNEHPKCIYINVHHNLYREISNNVMQILRDFSPTVQVYSVDEAFVDFTGLAKLYKKNYRELGNLLRQIILDELDIPVSIGISKTKTLAKLASDKAKVINSGIYTIGQSKIKSELIKTPIEDIWGIGRNLTKLFHKSGILTTAELVQKSDSWLDKTIGIRGIEMKHELLGECISQVTNEVKLPKSIQETSALETFSSDKSYLKNNLNYHIHVACSRLRKIDCKTSAVTLFLRTKDFKIYTCKKKLTEPTDFEIEISNIILNLLDKIFDNGILYRSTGVIFENLIENSKVQLNLFEDEKVQKRKKLAQAFDKLEAKFGKNIVRTGFTA